MSSMDRRRDSNPVNLEALGLWTFIGLFVVVVGGAWTSTHLATTLTGAPAAPPNPMLLLFGLKPGGATTWSTAATVIAIVEVVVPIAVVTLALVAAVLVGRTRSPSDVDRAVANMPTARRDAPLSEVYAQRVATQLGVQCLAGAYPGRYLGQTVPGAGSPATAAP